MFMPLSEQKVSTHSFDSPIEESDTGTGDPSFAHSTKVFGLETMTTKSKARRNFGSRPSDRRGERSLTGARTSAPSRIAVFSIVLLLAATVCHMSSRATVDAFCATRIGTSALAQRSPRPAPSSSALNLLRPDWMRRAGRIEQKKKERREFFESLRKRQEELGIPTTLFRKTEQKNDNQTPQRYKVVSSERRNNSTSSERSESDGLAIYPYVPENEVEANDESNILDWLEHGEIVTAVRTKTVADANAVPPPMAVVAATVIYNVRPQIVTDILWIEHDRGGWSPSIVDGVTRLIPIHDADGGDESQ